MKALDAGLMLVLLLVGTLIVVVHVAKAEPAPFTIYIRADGSIDPPTANITTFDNVTYTFTDNNLGGVAVERDNIVIDGAGSTLRGIWSGSVFDSDENNTCIGLNLTKRNNVTVQNLGVAYVPGGIVFTDSTNCTVQRSVISSSCPALSDTGIVIHASTNITIVDNQIVNCWIGIHLSGSGNKVVRNEIYNTGIGIELYYSSDNTIAENNFEVNSINLNFLVSTGDKFYHNNFHCYTEDDTLGADFVQDTAWSDGYPVGGNYWSDYNGTDIYSGPYQNLTGSDMVGDTPYVVAGNVTDVYPLMGLWTVLGENVTITPVRVANTVPILRIVFSTVTLEGITTTEMPQSGPASPTGLRVIDVYYYVETTASYSGKTEIMITFRISTMTNEEEKIMKLMQWNETSLQWIDITTHIDNEHGQIYGDTNKLSLFAVMWALRGDLNGDFTVDIYDALTLAGAYNSTPTSQNWNPNADINGDGTVDIYDALILASHYNEQYP